MTKSEDTNGNEEERKEFVELTEEGLTRVSSGNHSPESNHTSSTEAALASSHGSSKKRLQSGLNNGGGDVYLESVNDNDNNGIEVVEVETILETVC